MATLVLAAAGSAVGGAIGGTVAGLSSAVVGRAVGATLGRAIDERLLGGGSAAIESGRVDRFRITGAAEGEPVAQVFGRMRIGGQVIWASQFVETSSTQSTGGKGSGRSTTTTRYGYSVSLAIALCGGEISDVARVWADGEEVALGDLNMTLHRGTRDQLPDALMETVEGPGQVPAYRGTAYVVFEDLDLDPFGNRVPQFSFEVLRAEQPQSPRHGDDLQQIVTGVALIPGTGEYSLATTPVYMQAGPGDQRAANLNQLSGLSDMAASVRALRAELPKARAVSLVVCWFGDDLRCDQCLLKPKVEQQEADGDMPWEVCGIDRAGAETVIRENGSPVYGGTPCDRSVIEAIRHLNDQGQEVMFYPFVLMEQQALNGRSNPYDGGDHQPVLPWRGRITLSVAPGRAGSPDQSAAADAEVAAFFGAAEPGDFTLGEDSLHYDGPAQDWGLRRMILHYAHLCRLAGGVEAFCIGSELRGLTWIRGSEGFPAVTQLRRLAADVRAILGEEVRITYAADWSEYAGYTTPEGDRYFHLDPLWADANIDFVGIDNYVPLSDWRAGDQHLDAAQWDAIHDEAYLRANIEGGEGFDWFYHSEEARAAQIRTGITDGAHGEPWIWRIKDLRSWWQSAHFERIGGQRADTPTAWEPGSKPMRFTELGCAAIDKGSNQPNKFLDPKSSESSLPRFSNGLRDDLIQQQYLRAMFGHWGDPANNPRAELYEGRMLDMGHAYVWAWDARPFSAFPNRADLWTDSANYARGHWLNGRVGQRTLASVVEEICRDAGLAPTLVDTSGLWGIVRGFAVPDVAEARARLQPLMLRHGFDALERDGMLRFRPRDGRAGVTLLPQELAVLDDLEGDLERQRSPEAELMGRVRLRYVEWGADHGVRSHEAVLPDEATHAISQNELPMALTDAEARQCVARWLAEGRVARDTLRFGLPPSRLLSVGAGDVVQLEGARYRIDRVEQAQAQILEAVRIEQASYDPLLVEETLPQARAFVAPTQVLPLMMDLPLMRGDELPHAPHVCASARHWPGAVALYGADLEEDFTLETILPAQAGVGVLRAPLPAGPLGRWDLGGDLDLEMIAGSPESRADAAVWSGANRMALGDGSPDGWEVIQFGEAELIAPGRYLIRRRLRGQYGTEVQMRDIWPEGSLAVLLDETIGQLDLAPHLRRVMRNYRFGPSKRPYDDPAYVALGASFDGVGLRPYAPVHLRGRLGAAGELTLGWIRRSRVDGDGWDLSEIALGEEREAYRLRVLSGATVLRETEVETNEWVYGAAERAADGLSTGDVIEVAQISAVFGAGNAGRWVVPDLD